MDVLHPSHAVGDRDFTRAVAADAIAVAELAQQIRRWLERTVRIDAQRCADVVLAVYEALSNCVDHAYRGLGAPGMTTLEAIYDASYETVHVCVTDRGAWRSPTGTPTTTSRGRGLALMRALTDELTVNGTTTGTVVCLHFAGCRAADTHPTADLSTQLR